MGWFRPREGWMRRTAHVVEQMAPGGTERPDPGRVDRDDLARALMRLRLDLDRADTADRRDTLHRSLRCVDRLQRAVLEHDAPGAIYLGVRESELPPRLRSTAIEIDFAFGDRDGVVSEHDLASARRRYAVIRGPVGWNRLLLADDVERRLHPHRVLSTSTGARLRPEDWWAGGRDPLVRLRELVTRLEDATLGRTYADIAARFATCSDPEVRPVFEAALATVARQIVARKSPRPTLGDIARIGCEDPQIKAILHSPLEMAKHLKPDLLERIGPIPS